MQRATLPAEEMTVSDIWNKRRELLEKKVMDAGLELVDHAGAAAFELTIPGTSPELKITLGTVRRAPVVTQEMVDSICVSLYGGCFPTHQQVVRDALTAALEPDK